MRAFTLIFYLVITVNLLACGDKATQKISFSKQVQPILVSQCLSCHKSGGAGFEASGLSMETHQSLMKGTRFGPIIKPGDSVSSTLVRLIDGKADASISMPHGKKSLDQDSIKKIKDWIDQGAQNN